MSKLAIIRIRGHIRLGKDVAHTLSLLRLNKTNTCVIQENTPSLRGMLKKISNHVTWGEADATTQQKLSKEQEHHLTPPRGGFERKGVKLPYNKGGALGYRGEAINELIKRMTL